MCVQDFKLEACSHPPEVGVKHQYVNTLPMFSMLIDGSFPYNLFRYLMHHGII